MSETKKQWKVLWRLLIVVAFAMLYGFGGVELKWLRRFVAPAVLCIGMFLLSFDWRCLPQLPLMMFSLSLGYGSDVLIWKIVKRGIFGFANGVTSSGYNFFVKNWLCVGFQVIFLTSAYIVFGVWNPLPNARVEETLLGACIALVPVFSVKPKEES